MSTRLFVSILLLAMAGPLELVAAEPDPIRVVWSDGRKSEISEKQLKQHALSSRHPEYPREARRARLEGAGIFVLNIDKRTGAVSTIDIEQSTGHKVLDGYALSAFKTWRFNPGVFLKVRMPSVFYMQHYENPWVFF
jgi:TonB family protein